MREQLEDAISFYTTCQKYGGDDLARLIVKVTGVRVDSLADNQLATLTDEQAKALARHLRAGQPEERGKALYDTGEECVARLRELATSYARTLKQALAKKKGFKAAEAYLVGICTAIEVLTVNGNYYPEMADAMARTVERKESA